MGDRDRRCLDSPRCTLRRANLELLLAGAALIAALGLSATAPSRAEGAQGANPATVEPSPYRAHGAPT